MLCFLTIRNNAVFNDSSKISIPDIIDVFDYFNETEK